MSGKSPLELHHEFYERRQREIESRQPPKERDRAEPRAPSANGDAGEVHPVHRNGHKRHTPA